MSSVHKVWNDNSHLAPPLLTDMVGRAGEYCQGGGVPRSLHVHVQPLFDCQ